MEKAAEQTEEDVFHSHDSKTEIRMAAKYYADRAAKTLGNRTRGAKNRLEDLERNQLPKPPEPLRFHGIPEHTAASLGEPAVAAKDLAVEDRLAPLTIKVQPGDQLLVEGPNGSGKSTLLKILDGHLTDYEGELRIPEEVTVSRLEQDDDWQDLSITAQQAFEARVPAGTPSLVEMG